MLSREHMQGCVVITQPMHAWLSGQLARAWGNEHFGEVVPREEVCLGAQQHDVGHTQWEQTPQLNPQTGLPYSFFEMPRPWHLQLWSTAARLVLPQGRYAALLVSLHGTGLYQSVDLTKETPEMAQAVQDYLVGECAFQEELKRTLRTDSYYAPYATEKAVARNQRLLGVWDGLSLAICFGRKSQSFSRVPTATGTTTLTLTTGDGDPSQIFVTPWPFRSAQVPLVYEGRYLAQRFAHEAMMREALAHAPWITFKTTLLPHQEDEQKMSSDQAMQ